ncbi:MAG: M20 family metallopeptidase [Atribacterota bacterium]|nr:M20 family metallopeptidase [Atribacterota bacterium]MDD4895618.1 M20 family metallopeptidase [Atribacterota bacterium]MDD5636715.1 M20 family metallopeptidase [Atribacterota bacterium]
MNVRELSEKYQKEIIALRREFHQNPELSWQEVKTSNRVKEELKKIGIEGKRVADTGVVGLIKGREGKKVVALRADMDALPVQEVNNVSYRSQKDGVMHACGHDGHTAMLLVAAKILWELKDQFEGTVKLIFQPAEELIQGAKKMLEEGVLEGVDSILAIHIWSDLPSGKFSLEAGPRFAAGDRFKITVTGKGSHGAMPHMGIDAIVASSAIIMNLQTIISREVDPREPAVISIGKIKGGGNFNVISDQVVIEGTTRSFNYHLQKKFPLLMERIIKHTASSFNAQAELEYIEGAMPCVNDPMISKIAQTSLTKLYGDNIIIPYHKTTATEDFSFFLHRVPGVIAFLGTANKDKDIIFPHHHKQFNIDEDVLSVGTSLYAQFAIDFLNK